MDVILLQDVDNLGLAGQVVQVAVGYARNKLIPAKLALEATPSHLKVMEKKRAEFAQRAKKEKEKAQDLAKQVAAVRLTLAHKAGEKDKLYGSVTTMDLATALAAQGIEVDRRKIKLLEPIKTLGEYEVPIKLQSDVTATVKVSVIRAE